MVYCFEAIITSRGFHVYKERAWSAGKVSDEAKVELKSKPYSCAIKAKHKYFRRWKTLVMFLLKYCHLFISSLNKKVGEFKENWRETLFDSFRKCWGPTVPQIWIPRQMCHGYKGRIWKISILSILQRI